MVPRIKKFKKRWSRISTFRIFVCESSGFLLLFRSLAVYIDNTQRLEANIMHFNEDHNNGDTTIIIICPDYD